MKFLKQYKNLSKEIYVLFFGRIVTSMGSLIWPIMTLILKNKLGYNATTIATIDMILAIIQLPLVMVGGKLADCVNRKKIIVCCDMVTVICYFISGLIPLSFISVALFYVAGLFATIEGPSYDALVADLSDSDNREQAYSLQYLGMNLGLVLAPTLGGLLFENYLWLAFILTSVATLSSTLLILLFIKKLSVEKKHISEYEEKKEGVGIITILRERRILILYLAVSGFCALVYSEFNYLLPLHIENLYAAKGATIFGLLTSTNAIVVVVGTPLITTFLSKIIDVRKFLIGEVLIVTGLVSYTFSGRIIPLYFVLMTVFTLGEIFCTIASAPYMTRRVPSTHWGRVNSAINIVCGGFTSIGNIYIGKMVDMYGYMHAWILVAAVGFIAITLLIVLNVLDKKSFPLLYKNESEEADS